MLPGILGMAGISDVLAITDITRNGGDASPGAQFTLPGAGDIAFYSQLGESTTGTPPAAVVPAGWTSYLNVTGTTSTGNGYRVICAYKILIPADLGATFTGINGTARNRVAVSTFKTSRAVLSISSGGAVSNLQGAGDPTGQLIAAAGQVGNVLVLANGHGQTVITNTNFTWSPAATGSPYIADPNHIIGTSSATMAGFSYYPSGVSTALSHTVDIPAQGEFAAVMGAYFLLT